MQRHFPSGLRPLRALWPQTLWPRLLILLVAAMGPLLGLLLASALEDGNQVLRTGREQALQLARLGAEQQDDVLQEASSVLAVLARVEEVQARREGCAGLLQSVVADHPRLDALAVSDAGGTVICGSRPGSRGLSIAGLPYFHDAMQVRQAGQYALSSLRTNRVSGRPSIFVAMPLPSLDGGGAPDGVVVASVGLDWLSRLRPYTADLGDYLFQVIDSRDGTLLARFPDLRSRVGNRYPEHVLMGAIAASPRGGTVLGPDLDGVRRVFGFAPLPGRDAGPFLAVGIAEQSLRVQADGRFWFSVNLSLCALLLAFGAAWLVANRALLQPIQALAAAAAALGGGDLAARAAIGRGAAQELRSLGATFTRMGRRLRDRDRELGAVQHQLAESEGHHRLLANASNDMITRYDAEFRPVYVSPACLDVLGYDAVELEGIIRGALVHPEDVDGLARRFTGPLLAGQAVARASYRARHKDGRHVWLESSGRRLPDGAGFVVVTRDVSERKVLEARLEEANRQLRILVRQDGLTGLANRRRFDEVLGDEYRRAARSRHSLTLLMLDVDRFKLFNDTYGHPAGDSCLRALAAVLGTIPRRPGDLAARYGGEEFAILMAEADPDAAAAIGKRLCAAVRNMGIPHQHGFDGIVSVSVGVAVVRPGPGHAGPAALVEAADAALYAAKLAGRNRVCVAPSGISVA